MKSVFIQSILIALVVVPAIQAATIYETDFESGSLDPNWTTGSTAIGSDVGFVDIQKLPYNTGSNALRMQTKTPGGSSSLNYATVAVNVAGYKDIELTFDHFVKYDQANPFAASSFFGLANADGVAVSVDGSNWYRLWEPNTLPNLRVGGEFWTPGVSADVSGLLNSAGVVIGSDLFIRFQQFDNYQNANADGRGWDNIKLTGAVVPVPAGLLLATVGISSVLGGRRFLGRKQRSPIT